MAFSKKKSKEKRENLACLEEKLKELEQNLNCNESLEQYGIYKNELNNIYNDISNGIKIRSKYDWYEFGEKSNKFFLNLEANRATQSAVRKVISNEQEITYISKINNHILQFYQNLFKEKQSTSENRFNSLLNDLNIPSLNSEEMLSCEGNLTEQEIYKSLTNFKNNKSPGNDGLTKEFYCCFWNDIEDIFMKSLCESKKLKQLCVSQRQAIIKLLEKPNKDKRYVANWRPISLLNFDLKIISKSVAARLKNVLGKLIDAKQTAYVKERFIGESGRLTDDVLKVCDMHMLSGYLLTVYFEKAFDSLNHNFLIAVLKKYGFGDDFIDWVLSLINSQESCVINGGHSTKYSPLEHGAGQGDPISAYLFVLALEIFFILIKTNNDIQVIEIFNHEFLYTAYADDKTFFVKDLNSVKIILSSLDQFCTFSGLRPNLSKCEIAGIGVLKDANVALCGLKSVNLSKESIKILGVHLSYNEKIQNELNFSRDI